MAAAGGKAVDPIDAMGKVGIGEASVLHSSAAVLNLMTTVDDLNALPAPDVPAPTFDP